MRGPPTASTRVLPAAIGRTRSASSITTLEKSTYRMTGCDRSPPLITGCSSRPTPSRRPGHVGLQGGRLRRDWLAVQVQGERERLRLLREVHDGGERLVAEGPVEGLADREGRGARVPPAPGG